LPRLLLRITLRLVAVVLVGQIKLIELPLLAGGAAVL
jgi:hypothetical protein